MTTPSLLQYAHCVYDADGDRAVQYSPLHVILTSRRIISPVCLRWLYFTAGPLMSRVA